MIAVQFIIFQLLSDAGGGLPPIVRSHPTTSCRRDHGTSARVLQASRRRPSTLSRSSAARRENSQPQTAQTRRGKEQSWVRELWPHRQRVRAPTRSRQEAPSSGQGVLA